MALPCDGLSSAQRVGLPVNMLCLCVTAESRGVLFVLYTNIGGLTHLSRVILFKALALGGYTCFSGYVVIT